MRNFFQLVNLKFLIIVFFGFLGLSVFSKVDAHPGRLASDGCHNQKATGERHCHENPASEPKKKINIKTNRFRTLNPSKSINVIANTLSICFICIAIFLRKLYGAL